MTREELIDGFERRITYLRLSVTDQCQFRCVYCMPPEGIPMLPRNHYMQPDEIELLVRAMAGVGVSRVRLTGGEPLLRKDIVDLVHMVAAVDGVDDVALTTNGQLLPRLVDELKAAGLRRVNISLDSLDPKRFREVTLSNSFADVWEGIQRTLAAGLRVKLNAVVLKGISPAEVDAFARLAFDNDLEVRFIEFMPLCGTGWKPDLTLPISQVRSWISKHYELVPMERGTEVAESYLLKGGRGRIGFIGSMTEPFCSTCSRIRVSATGQVQLCLFSKVTYNLLPLLRRRTSVHEVQSELRRIVLSKPAKHPWTDGKVAVLPEANAMIRTIGG